MLMQQQMHPRILGQPGTMEGLECGLAYDGSGFFSPNCRLMVQRSDGIWRYGQLQTKRADGALVVVVSVDGSTKTFTPAWFGLAMGLRV
jgi:hypothetical protein